MSSVKLILRSDVDGVGKRGDIVEVSRGYARNFLEPRGLAIPSTPGAEAQAEAMRRSRALRDAQDREAAQEVAKVLVSTTIEIAVRVGDGGKLFGAVHAGDISDAVTAQTSVELDKRSVHLDDPIKTTGTHAAQVRLPGDVEFPLTIEVVEA